MKLCAPTSVAFTCATTTITESTTLTCSMSAQPILSVSAEAVADFVQARRVRKEVVSICNQWLESNPRTAPLPPGSKFPEKQYWVLATLAEAQIGLEDEALGQQRLEEAFAAAPEEWMKESTQEQVTKLKALLASVSAEEAPGRLISTIRVAAK